VPGARATLLGLVAASAGLGRVLGALVGGPVWLAGGLTATGLCAASLSTLALLLLSWGLRGWRRHDV